MTEENGVWTITTSTTLKTITLKFKLGEAFSETTLDGRVAQTVACRDGDVLILDQRGNKAKGEKDSKMIRDFKGDMMYMQLIAEGVVCKRVYKRIVE